VKCNSNVSAQSKTYVYIRACHAAERRLLGQSNQMALQFKGVVCTGKPQNGLVNSSCRTAVTASAGHVLFFNDDGQLVSRPTAAAAHMSYLYVAVLSFCDF
jgi:hypothetical protein